VAGGTGLPEALPAALGPPPGALYTELCAQPSSVPSPPSAAVQLPKGDDWLHEPKWDGFRFQVIKDGAGVRFYSRHGGEYTDRLPGMVEAFGKLPAQRPSSISATMPTRWRIFEGNHKPAGRGCRLDEWHGSSDVGMTGIALRASSAASVSSGKNDKAGHAR
jgi:ATP dependent DNA ligase domain